MGIFTESKPLVQKKPGRALGTRVSGLWASLFSAVVAGGLVLTGATSKRTLNILLVLCP